MRSPGYLPLFIAAALFLSHGVSPAQPITLLNVSYDPTRELAEVAQKYSKQFPSIELFTVDDLFGGWTNAQKTYFDDGGVFDQIYEP